MEENAEILTEEELKEAIKTIFKRSQTDLEFRKLCLSNPAEAVRKITGKSLPEGFKLQFLDKDPEPPQEEGE
jgi:hypothetical protein